MSRSLFEITEDLAELEARLDAIDEGQDDSELLEWMNSLSNERQQKIDAYCWLIRKLYAEADAAKAIASEFRYKAEQRENKAELLKSLVMQHMKALGESKLIGKQFTVAIQRNGGNLPVEITDEAAIPTALCELKRIPVKNLIRLALESGQAVDGARLGERGESIRIK